MTTQQLKKRMAQELTAHDGADLGSSLGQFFYSVEDVMLLLDKISTEEEGG